MALDAKTQSRLLAATTAAALRVLAESGVKAEPIRDQSGLAEDGAEVRIVLTLKRDDGGEGPQGAD